MDKVTKALHTTLRKHFAINWVEKSQSFFFQGTLIVFAKAVLLVLQMKRNVRFQLLQEQE